MHHDFLSARSQLVRANPGSSRRLVSYLPLPAIPNELLVFAS